MPTRKSQGEEIADLADYLRGVERALGDHGDRLDPSRTFDGDVVRMVDNVMRAARDARIYIEANGLAKTRPVR